MPINVGELESLRSSLHSGTRPPIAFDRSQGYSSQTPEDIAKKDSLESGRIREKLSNLLKLFSLKSTAAAKIRQPFQADNDDWIATDSWTKYLEEIEHPKPILASHAHPILFLNRKLSTVANASSEQYTEGHIINTTKGYPATTVNAGWVDPQNSRNSRLINSAGAIIAPTKSPLSEFMTSSPECSE